MNTIKRATIAASITLAASALITTSPVTAQGTDHPDCGDGTRVEINVNAPTYTVQPEHAGLTHWIKAGNNPHFDYAAPNAGDIIGDGKTSSWPKNDNGEPHDISHIDVCIPGDPPPVTNPPRTDPECVGDETLFKGLTPGDPIPYDGRVWIATGAHHFLGDREAGWTVPTEWTFTSGTHDVQHADLCAVPPPPPDEDPCDPSTYNGSVADKLAETDPPIQCVAYQGDVSCGALSIEVVLNKTPYVYGISYSEGPPGWNFDTDASDITFPEDYNGGSVDIYFWFVGPESDFITAIPGLPWFEVSAQSVTVDTDCEPDPTTTTEPEPTTPTTDPPESTPETTEPPATTVPATTEPEPAPTTTEPELVTPPTTVKRAEACLLRDGTVLDTRFSWEYDWATPYPDVVGYTRWTVTPCRPTVSDTTTTVAAPSELPETGSDATRLAAGIGALLIAVGAAAVAATRRTVTS